MRRASQSATMTAWALFFGCLLLPCCWVSGKEQGTPDGHQQLTRISEGGSADTSMDIELLLVGKPLVGVVEEGKSRLVHFGALPRENKFPDILVYLEAVDPDSEVDIYCTPYHRLNAEYPPDKISAEWKSTKHGDVFISSMSTQYREAIIEKERDGAKLKVAAFGCAIRGSSGGNSKFQLTVRLSFDERRLIPEQELAMSGIFKDCCSDDKTCHRWLLNEQKADGEKEKELGKVEFDFCHRSGSMCNSKGEVIRLDLRAYGLKCKMPIKHLLKMTTLEALDLSDNSIHADIAVDVSKLGALRRLKDLNLAHNFIFGEMHIPGFCSALLQNLRTLYLSDNFISGRIPSCMFTESQSLEELYLSRNHFSGYVSDVFPASSALRALALSENGLTGGLPSSLGRLKMLRVLYLDGNEFNGPIPDAFVGMKSLEVLDLSKNRLSSFPASWSTSWEPPRTLRIVKLQKNKLRGRMPTRLLRARSLEWLDISRNSVSGPLFAKRGMFPNMIHLNVSRNLLTGSIPSEHVSMRLFGNKRSNGPRHVFDVSFNKLSGAIPEFLYQEMTPTIVETEIYLEGNRFTCHRWRTLNYIPNFECSTHARSAELDNRSTDHFLQEEQAQRDLISSLEHGRGTSKNSEDAHGHVQLQSSGEDSGDDPAADAIVGTVTALLGVAVLIAVIALIVKFKKSRDRRLGLQYGAAEDVDSEDGIEGNASGVNPGPSQPPQNASSMEQASLSS